MPVVASFVIPNVFPVGEVTVTLQPVALPDAALTHAPLPVAVLIDLSTPARFVGLTLA
jgi:hypothetical protein